MKRSTVVGRFGSAGIAGAVAIVVAVLFNTTATRALRAEHDTLLAQAQRAEAALRGGGSTGERPLEPADELRAFHASFPRTDASTALLRQIHDAASEQGLSMPSGEYRVERRAGQALERYIVTLPLSGSYKAIRAFVAAVLANVPAAAVDDIQLRRESTLSPTIEARVRISLYTRPAVSP